MKAYITTGIPGSGKSTKAMEMIGNNPNLVRVNRDEFRIQVLQDRGRKINWTNAMDKSVDGEASKRHENAIRLAAREGKDLIVDNCHLSEGSRKRIIFMLRDLGYENIEIISTWDVPLDVCLERNAKREGIGLGPVSTSVIRKMYNDHFADNVKVMNTQLPNFVENDLPRCIIVDIDGTLAAKSDRSPYDESRVFEDSVRNHVAMIVKRLGMTEADHVFVFSGRTNACRQDTMRWLQEKAGFDTDFSWSLHMRTVGDKRRDGIIKTELFNGWVLGKFNVLAVFDDRAQVIRECWKPLNVPVFRCGVIDEDDF